MNMYQYGMVNVDIIVRPPSCQQPIDAHLHSLLNYNYIVFLERVNT